MLQGFQDWIAMPFSPDMNALHWFLFIGLLIVLTTLWHFILATLGG